MLNQNPASRQSSSSRSEILEGEKCFTLMQHNSLLVISLDDEVSSARWYARRISQLTFVIDGVASVLISSISRNRSIDITLCHQFLRFRLNYVV
jgi:hypothetical protein